MNGIEREIQHLHVAHLAQRLDSIERTVISLEKMVIEMNRILSTALPHLATQPPLPPVRVELRSVEAIRADLINWLLKVIVFGIPSIFVMIALLAALS